jgi:hypothetical protein
LVVVNRRKERRSRVNGWYQKVDIETGECLGTKVREADTREREFWDDMLADDGFKDFVRKGYQIGGEIEELDLDLEAE